jgi:L-2-hydroxyglutarate oxidase LhgO
VEFAFVARLIAMAQRQGGGTVDNTTQAQVLEASVMMSCAGMNSLSQSW